MPFLDVILVLFTGSAVVFDIKERRIPNWLVLLAFTGGVLLNSLQGRTQLFNSFCGFGLGIGLLIVPFALGWLGAGDVKFLGAIGAIVGTPWIPRIVFYSALAGGVLALISLCLKDIQLQAFHTVWRDTKLLIMSRGAVLPETRGISDRSGSRTIPYGIAIGLGTLIAFYVDPRGEWAGF